MSESQESKDEFRYAHLTSVKYTGYNEIRWHADISNILDLTNTMTIVTGEELEPLLSERPTEREDRLHSDFHYRVRLARSILVASMSDSQRYLLDDLEKPTDMWRILYRRLQDRRDASRRTLYHEFEKCHWLPADDLDTYIYRMAAVRHKLRGTAVEINEPMLVAQILARLPGDWSHTAIQAISPKIETVEEVRIALRRFESAIRRFMQQQQEKNGTESTPKRQEKEKMESSPKGKIGKSWNIYPSGQKEKSWKLYQNGCIGRTWNLY